MKSLLDLIKEAVAQGAAIIKTIVAVQADGTIVFDDGSTTKAPPSAKPKKGDKVALIDPNAAVKTAPIVPIIKDKIPPELPTVVADQDVKKFILPHPMWGDDEDPSFYVLYRGGYSTGGDVGDWELKIMDLDGNPVTDKFENFILIDDGKYVPDWNSTTEFNPDTGNYDVKDEYKNPWRIPFGIKGSRGLGVPALAWSGIPAQFKNGPYYYVLMCGSREDEPYIGVAIQNIFGGEVTHIYNVLVANGSLIWAPYPVRGKSPVCRYDKDGNIILIPSIWGYFDSAGVGTTDAAVSDDFFDIVEFVSGGKIYWINRESEEIISLSIPLGGDEFIGVVCPVQRSDENYENILRARNHKWGTSFMVDHFEEQKLENSEVNPVSSGDQLLRGTVENAYLLNSMYVFGKVYDGDSYITDHGYSSVKDDVLLPYAIAEHRSIENKHVYTGVRVQKKDLSEFPMNEIRVTIECAGNVVEDSGWVKPARIWGQDISQSPSPSGLEGAISGEIIIRPINYSILHAFHNKQFDVVVYKKIVYTSHEYDHLASCYVHRGLPVDGDRNVARTLIKSQVTHHIYVNGVITDLPYSYTLREYMFTGVTEEFNTPSITPSPNDCYLVGLSPTDDWVGHSGEMALWTGSEWVYHSPKLLAFVQDRPVCDVGYQKVFDARPNPPSSVPFSMNRFFRVGENATEEWEGKDGQLAEWTGSTWKFHDGAEGARLFDNHAPVYNQEDNKHITRIFTSVANSRLLFTFNIFPVRYRHEVNVTEVFAGGYGYDALTYDYYTDDGLPYFPPSSDKSFGKRDSKMYGDDVSRDIYDIDVETPVRSMMFNITGGYIDDVPTPEVTDVLNRFSINRMNSIVLIYG